MEHNHSSKKKFDLKCVHLVEKYFKNIDFRDMVGYSYQIKDDDYNKYEEILSEIIDKSVFVNIYNNSPKYTKN